MTRRRALPLAIGVLVVAVIVFEVATAGPGNTGKPAPALPTAVLQAPKTTLATLRGAPAVVNFWASWCEPCRRESPEVERFYRSLHGEAGLVGIDYTDQASAARGFISNYGLTYPMLSDPDGVYGARYGFSGLPTTVILDARGRIFETLRGPQTAATLKQAVREATTP